MALAAEPQLIGTHDPRKGILFMVGGLALFSILNGAVKAQAGLFPLNQIIFFRNGFGLLALLLLVRMMGGTALLATKRPLAQLWQSTTFTAILLLMFFAYRHMPLADATAISFFQPLIATVLGAFILRERPSLASWVAVFIGLGGVMLMVQPSGQGMGEMSRLGAMAALAATLLSALSLIQQRSLSRTDETLTIVFYTMLYSTLTMTPTLFWSWTQPTFPQLAGLVAMGLASGFCQYLTTRALYFAPVATIAPINYTKMIWAVLIGYVWFGDVPTIWVLAGSGIVILAALIVMRKPAVAPAVPLGDAP
ncbi:MAG: hypothetical protein CFE31_07695 [Rhizobiales bacterium PAR1]|nr:MAG: hypothetical protein CFE31_07695 [Rhizobiales bacterium PAR1]